MLVSCGTHSLSLSLSLLMADPSRNAEDQSCTEQPQNYDAAFGRVFDHGEKQTSGAGGSASRSFLHKGKSDSLIIRSTSLDKELRTEGSVLRRVAQRQGATLQLRASHPFNKQHRDSDYNHGELAARTSANMLSRTSSTASLQLGVAGPLVLSSHATLTASTSNNNVSQESTGDSDDMHFRLHREKDVASDSSVPIDIADEINQKVVSLPLPISLKFVNVAYKVAINRDQYPSRLLQYCGLRSKETRRSKKEKKVLKGVSGCVQPGELLALMGPSGSGKTTLLKVLSGRLAATSSSSSGQQCTGTITYNGMPYSKAFKRRMGFVMQDDVLYPHLTVRETLIYTALLRLSKRLSTDEKIQRALEVIFELDLERCQDTMIGGPFLLGISGGERKRVSIGQEILIDPSLLFLDEPTSGLDSTTALRIVRVLRRNSMIGRTIVTTIHQPSSRLFHMFDKILLLSKGTLIYFGKVSEVMGFFSSIGFNPQLAMNPADFLLDLASCNVNDVSMPTELLAQQQTHADATIGPISKHPSAKSIREYLAMSYEATLVEDSYVGTQLDEHFQQELMDDSMLKGIVSDADNPLLRYKTKEREDEYWCSTWWAQLRVLYVRGLRERRHEYLSSLRVLQVLASALVIGCLWWHSSFRTERQLVDQVGLLFFIATYWCFFPLFTALFTFPQERAILAKERASNMYRLSAYFMARTLADIPLDFCLPFLFHIIVYFMTRLRSTPAAFLLTLLTILLSTIASQGMGVAIGALMMDLKRATTLASVTLLTFMLSGGFFVQSLPKFISWIKYLSYNYYTFKLLVKIQYDDEQLFNCNTPIGCQTIGRSTILHGISLDGGHIEAVVLLSMVFGYRLLAYIALRRMRLVV